MKKEFTEIIEFATKFRHELHENPELTWEEYNTALKIRNFLDTYNIPWTEYAKTGTVAYLAQKEDGIHVALRCDIDALPINGLTTLNDTKNRDILS